MRTSIYDAVIFVVMHLLSMVSPQFVIILPCTFAPSCVEDEYRPSTISCYKWLFILNIVNTQTILNGIVRRCKHPAVDWQWAGNKEQSAQISVLSSGLPNGRRDGRQSFCVLRGQLYQSRVSARSWCAESSAIADEPRDAHRCQLNLKSCQLMHNCTKQDWSSANAAGD